MITDIFYPPTQNGLQKTLDANLLTGVTASATLNNVTGIQNKKGIMVIDRVDGNNNLTPNKREYISFDGTSGVTTVTLGRGLGGSTDQDHSVGAIVEFVNDVVQQEALLAELEAINTAVSALPTADSITTFTNKTLTSPKINENVALTATATQLNKVVQTKSVARIYNGSTQVIPGTNVMTVVNFDTVNIDTNNEINTTSHSFVAKKAGNYLVSFNAMFQTGGFRAIAQILVNGSRWGESANESLAQFSTLNITNIVPMAIGDALTFGISQNSGANKTFHSDFSAIFVSITEL